MSIEFRSFLNYRIMTFLIPESNASREVGRQRFIMRSPGGRSGGARYCQNL
jgi:hypothetical protein